MNLFIHKQILILHAILYVCEIWLFIMGFCPINVIYVVEIYNQTLT